MKYLKTFFPILIIPILIILFIFKTASGHDTIDFKPLLLLEKEKPNTSKKRLNHMFTFSLRCSALLNSLGKEMENGKLITISRNFNQSAYVSLLLIKKKNADVLRQQVANYINKFIKIYTPILKDNYTKNKKHIEGSDILEGDYQACKKFSSKTNSFLRANGFQVLK